MEDAYEGALGAGTLKLVLYTKTRDLLWCAFVVARFCRFPTWTAIHKRCCVTCGTRAGRVWRCRAFTRTNWAKFFVFCMCPLAYLQVPRLKIHVFDSPLVMLKVPKTIAVLCVCVLWINGGYNKRTKGRIGMVEAGHTLSLHITMTFLRAQCASCCAHRYFACESQQDIPCYGDSEVTAHVW